MTRPAHIRRLAAIAVVIIALVAIILTEDGARPQAVRQPPATPVPAAPSHPTLPRPRDASSRPSAVAAASTYALLARDWSADTYRAARDRQVTLAGGEYRRRLLAAAPTNAQLAQLESDRASMLAAITGTRVTGRRGPDTLVTVTLDERTELAGQAFTTATSYRVSLRQGAGRWRVTGFTAVPDAEGAP